MRLFPSPRTSGGVSGTDFTSLIGQSSPEEATLNRIQQELAGPGSPTPSQPHLFLQDVAQIGGPTITTVNLWVPLDQDARARHLLVAAGFDIGGS